MEANRTAETAPEAPTALYPYALNFKALIFSTPTKQKMLTAAVISMRISVTI